MNVRPPETDDQLFVRLRAGDESAFVGLYHKRQGAIYRFALHMAMSISHRISGIALVVGTFVVLYWLGAAARGPETYASAAAVLGSWFGRLLLFGWSIALYYHLCNGIRHLLWDSGKLFEIGEIKKSGQVVLAATAVLTVVSWIVGLSL